MNLVRSAIARVRAATNRSRMILSRSRHLLALKPIERQQPVVIATIQPEFVSVSPVFNEPVEGLSLCAGSDLMNTMACDSPSIATQNSQFIAFPIETSYSLIVDEPSIGSPDAMQSAPNPEPAEDFQIVQRLLDDNTSEADRIALIESHRDNAIDLIKIMSDDLKPDTPEESRRIPWLWRLARLVGESPDLYQSFRLLEVVLPDDDEPMNNWQTVVIGGGIVAGISAHGLWPKSEIERLIGDDSRLLKRWQRALRLAERKADDLTVSEGTRYDALRMVAMAGWESAGSILLEYLHDREHHELQMGAISGTADLDEPQATQALLDLLPQLSETNLQVAVSGMLRGEKRTEAFLEYIERNPSQIRILSESQLDQLLQSPVDTIRTRTEAIVLRKQP